LTNAPVAETPCGMSESAPDQNFQNYKQAERKALQIVAEMKAASANKVDIELALLVAVFELHKETVPAATIASIVQGHLKQIVPHYAVKSPGGR
jgi:indole-3-glycerol phosphate synthase